MLTPGHYFAFCQYYIELKEYRDGLEQCVTELDELQNENPPDEKKIKFKEEQVKFYEGLERHAYENKFSIAQASLKVELKGLKLPIIRDSYVFNETEMILKGKILRKPKSYHFFFTLTEGGNLIAELDDIREYDPIG